MATMAYDWLKHFSISSLQSLNGFWQNLAGSKSSMSSTDFVFLCRSVIQNGRLCLWLAHTFFDFFSATADRILTNFGRKEVLSVFYKVCVFRADRSSKTAAFASDWLTHFSTSSLQPLTGFWRILAGNESSASSTKFVFFVPIGHLRWLSLPLISWNNFAFFPAIAEWIFTKLERKQVLFYQVCVFRADRSSKMVALASDWLKHFSPSFQQRQNRFWWNLTRNKSLTSTTKGVYMVYIRKRPPF